MSVAAPPGQAAPFYIRKGKDRQVYIDNSRVE